MTTADAARKLPEKLWVVFTDDADGDWEPDLAWEDRDGADNHEANMLRDDDEPPLRTCVAEYVRARTLRDSLGKPVETAEAFSIRLADLCDLIPSGHVWNVQRGRALIEQRDAAIRAEGQTLVALATRIMRHCNEQPECPFCGIEDGDHEAGDLCSELESALSPPKATVHAD